jgi:hypothetical protein
MYRIIVIINNLLEDLFMEMNQDSGKKIEDVINNVLSGETKKNAMDFIGCLMENKISLENLKETLWNVKFKDKCIYICVDGVMEKPGPWTIWFEGDYSKESDKISFDLNLKEIAWKNVNFCASCGGKCSPGKQATIFDKNFDKVCGSVMAFTNPDIETMKCAKMLVKCYFC